MKEELISSSSSMNSGSEDENDPHQLTINEHYAKAFQYRKEREELVKLKEKYGSDADTDDLNSDDDSESDESEDEDGDELTPALDAAILRTLARIKARDPGIYDAERNVFDEEHSKSGTLPSAPTRAKETRSSKPVVTLREHRLAAALDVASARSSASLEYPSPSPAPLTHVAEEVVTLPERRLAASLDVVTSARSSASLEYPSPPSLTHVAEQAALRAETISAFHSGLDVRETDAGDAGEEEEGGLFTLREKTRDEVEREEAEYRAYLEREVGPLEKILDFGEEGNVRDETEREEVHVHADETSPGGKKKKKKGKKVVEEPQETDKVFLLNYILHRGWIDRSARRIPTYKEITVGTTSHDDPGPSLTPSGADVVADANGDLLEDEDEFDEVAERFESSYNFRFEEPDAAHISSFPRAVESVRRPTEHAERRRAARERRQERKEAEKAQRREEVKRLRGLKTREMEAKLERIGKEGGWARGHALDALDLDAEWDAAAHDRQMAAVLAETDRVDFDGNEKPTWDDDFDVGDIVPPSEEEQPRVSAAKERKKVKKKEKRKRAREGDVGADVVGVDEMDADAIEEGGDRWDEVEWDGTEEMRKRVLDQYMEELHELEFNDMVAGKPTHFRYIPVAKTAYALTPAEILLADDKDLNEYVGLKKIAPYRKQRETWDAKRTERLREFKKKVAERAREAGMDDVNAAEHVVDGVHKAKTRKGRKERMREKAARDPSPEEAEVTIDNDMKSPDSARGDIYAKQWRNDGGWVDTGSTSEPVKKKRRRQKRVEKYIGQAET